MRNKFYKVKKTWLSCSGKIINSNVITNEVKPIEQGDLLNDVTTHYASVRYEYEVEQQKYYSNKIQLFPSIVSSNESFSEKVIERYPLGSSVTVFYNPKKYSDAVLDVSLKNSWIFIIGAFVFGMAALFLYLK